MNQFWNLTRFHLDYYLKPRFESKKARNRYLGLVALLCVFFIPLIAMFLGALYGMAELAVQTGATDALLSTIFFTALIMVVVFSLNSYIQIMFFAKDNEILAAMPVKQSHVYIAKMLTTTLSEMFISAILILPTTIILAIVYAKHGMSVPIGYWFGIPFAIVTVPLLAVLVVSIAAFPLVKVITFFRKHPTLGVVVGIAAVLGVIAAIYIPLYGTIIPSMEEGGGSEISGNMADTIFGIGTYFYPTAALARMMLATPGLHPALNALIYSAIVIGAFAIGVGLSLLMYRSTLRSIMETTGGTFKARKNAIEKQSDPVYALMKREVTSIMRNYQMAMQSLMQLAMAPFMVGLFGWIFSRQMSAGAMTNPEVAQMNFGLITTGISVMMTAMFMGGSNTIATIAFSREGKEFALLKTFPVTGRDIVRSKLLFADIVTVIGVALCTIVFAFISKSGIIDKILFFPCVLLLTLPVNAFALKRDLVNPKLNWTVIREITKNNFSMFIPMLVIMVGAFIVLGASILLAMRLSQTYASLALWGIVAVLGIAYYFVFRFRKFDHCERYFEQIES